MRSTGAAQLFESTPREVSEMNSFLYNVRFFLAMIFHGHDWRAN